MASSKSTTSISNNSIPFVGSKKVEISKVLWILSLILWVFTFVLLLIALIILTTNTIDQEYSLVTYIGVRKFYDLYAYRYMLSSIVIGIAYSLLQLGISIYHYTSGDCTATDKSNYPLLYGDMIMSYFLATGAAAGFGVTKDMNRLFDSIYKYYPFEEADEFCAKGYASASLVLIAFFCTATLVVISSHAIAKHGNGN